MLPMKAIDSRRLRNAFVFLALLLLSAFTANANPVEIGDEPGPIFVFGMISAITVAILAAILAEAVCVTIILRKSRTPRFFILWLMGMHLVSYPIFLGLMALGRGISGITLLIMDEGLIVFLEGALIHVMCRMAPSRVESQPVPSPSKALLASFLGNICSAVVFPGLAVVIGLLAHLVGSESD
jgi:hypothetical protein